MPGGRLVNVGGVLGSGDVNWLEKNKLEDGI